jgi:deglycase
VIKAGGDYVDEPVVRDGNIITSRLQGDVPEFCREIVSYLEEAPMRRNSNASRRSR